MAGRTSSWRPTRARSRCYSTLAVDAVAEPRLSIVAAPGSWSQRRVVRKRLGGQVGKVNTSSRGAGEDHGEGWGSEGPGCGRFEHRRGDVGSVLVDAPDVRVGPVCRDAFVRGQGDE